MNPEELAQLIRAGLPGAEVWVVGREIHALSIEALTPEESR